MKTLKKVLSMALAFALLVGGLVVLPQEAKAAEYTAKLGYADSEWAVQEWGDNVSTTVTGAGTYTLSLDIPAGSTATGAAVFVVDIVGATEGLAANGQKISVTDLKVKADGTDLAVDLSKVLVGDIENNGNCRIEIYNEYGGTKEASPIDTAALTASTNITVEFTVDIVADGHTAVLGYADPAWTVQEWGENVSTTVTGAGTYNLTWNIPEGTTASGAVVFVIDITGAAADLLATGKEYNVTDLKIKTDGTELAVDVSKLVDGDIEDNGNYRIEIYNEYGNTKNDPPIDVNALVASTSLVIDFTLEVVDASTDTPGTDAPTVEPFNPEGSYNAYFGLQSPSWTYRDPWNSDNGIGSENWGQWVINNDTGSTYGTVTDAVVAGNGTYSVSLKEIGSVFADEFANNTDALDHFRILMISTDIPYTEDIQITDVKLIMDGKTVTTYPEAFLDPDATDYVKILVQNEWNAELKETLPFYAAPTESIEMQFTISGFSYDKGGSDESNTQEPNTQEPSSQNPGTSDGTDTSTQTPSGDWLPIIIGVIVVVAVVAVVVVVLKKKKTN